VKIGLTYDLKTNITLRPGGVDDEAEELRMPESRSSTFANV
jgi:hypothetical protein